jgi:hypothetical protein
MFLYGAAWAIGLLLMWCVGSTGFRLGLHSGSGRILRPEIDREIDMLKKLALGGAVLAAFAGMGLATPAQANSGVPWPSNENKFNVSEQSDNVVVCGNRGIGDILIPVIPLAPVTFADREEVDCSIRAYQDQD